MLFPFLLFPFFFFSFCTLLHTAHVRATKTLKELGKRRSLESQRPQERLQTSISRLDQPFLQQSSLEIPGSWEYSRLSLAGGSNFRRPPKATSSGRAADSTH
ncbi:predicted protein [Histoplasma capsulatum var. duboisii H88]|uniref:Predicted protein n=1 Tax=Ajellomyces capsulatus (strain H88) TaxID=544711 RepID=F0UIQ8_AJEC8|nr:predicted protein [Histoplasma capsulatum var. duboisii H88]